MTVKREMLDALYHRLREVQVFAHARRDHLKNNPPEPTFIGKGRARREVKPMDRQLLAYEMAELMLDCTINDYIRLHSGGEPT